MPRQTAFVRPPPIPTQSFQNRVFDFYERFIHCDSSEQITEWYDLTASEIAPALPKRNEAEFHPDLEKTEAENARLVTEPFVGRDKTGEPILGYFPRILQSDVLETTYEALSEYVDAVKPNRKGGPNTEERDEVVRNDDSTAYDQRHPPCPRLEKLFGHRYRLMHLGAWHATGHPNEPPVVSGDYIGTAGRLSHGYDLIRSLMFLTTELSILFAAFNTLAWSSARRFIAALNHFHPATNICKAGDYECWAHRAFLFNLETHCHRDIRDAMFGYAVIVVFGSFTGGEFVVPQLRLKFPHRPGDVIIIKGQLLQHFVTPWKPKEKGGERFCITHFTHQNLIDSVEERLETIGLGDETISGVSKKKVKGNQKGSSGDMETGKRKSTRNKMKK